MSSKKLLVPAVMVSMAVGAAVASTDAAATAGPSGAAHVVPAVMSQRAPATYPVPPSLADYTKQKFAETQMSMWWGDPDPDPGHCATISGSDSGWDDSDCMR